LTSKRKEKKVGCFERLIKRQRERERCALSSPNRRPRGRRRRRRFGAEDDEKGKRSFMVSPRPPSTTTTMEDLVLETHRRHHRSLRSQRRLCRVAVDVAGRV